MGGQGTETRVWDHLRHGGRQELIPLLASFSDSCFQVSVLTLADDEGGYRQSNEVVPLDAILKSVPKPLLGLKSLNCNYNARNRNPRRFPKRFSIMAWVGLIS